MYKNTILKNLSWSLLQDLIFSGVGTLFYLFLARKLGDDGLGLYSYVVAILAFINIGFDLGITSYFWRHWATDTSTIRKDIQQILSVKLVLTFVVALLLGSYVAVTDQELWPHFFVIFLIGFFEGLRAIQLSYFRSQNIFEKVFFVNALERTITFTGGLAMLFLGYGVFHVLLFALIGQVISALLAFILYPLPLPSWPRKETFLLLKLGLPIFLIAFFNSSYQKVDAIIIRFLLGLDAVGMYSASYRVLETLSLIPSIIILSFFPSISQIIAQKNEKGLQQVMDKSIRYLGSVSAFVAFFFTFYANEILDFLYGDDFIASGRILAILGWGTIFFFASAPLYTAVLASKKDREMGIRLILLNIFNASGNLLFVPFFGIEASALFTVMTEALSFFILLRILRLSFNFLWVLQISAILLAQAALLARWHPPLFIALLLTGSVYVICLISLKIFDYHDFYRQKET